MRYPNTANEFSRTKPHFGFCTTRPEHVSHTSSCTLFRIGSEKMFALLCFKLPTGEGEAREKACVAYLRTLTLSRALSLSLALALSLAIWLFFPLQRGAPGRPDAGSAPTAPMAIGAGGPPGAWQNTATPTPLATSTWTSPNGIPYGGEGRLSGGELCASAFPLGTACVNACVGEALSSLTPAAPLPPAPCVSRRAAPVVLGSGRQRRVLHRRFASRARLRVTARAPFGACRHVCANLQK